MSNLIISCVSVIGIGCMFSIGFILGCFISYITYRVLELIVGRVKKWLKL